MVSGPVSAVISNLLVCLSSLCVSPSTQPVRLTSTLYCVLYQYAKAAVFILTACIAEPAMALWCVNLESQYLLVKRV